MHFLAEQTLSPHETAMPARTWRPPVETPAGARFKPGPATLFVTVPSPPHPLQTPPVHVWVPEKQLRILPSADFPRLK